MQSKMRVQFTGGLGLCLLSLPLIARVVPRPTPVPISPATLPLPSLGRNGPCEAMLREASQYRTQAKIAVVERRVVLERWDPEGMASVDPEAWRLQQMAADPDGDLERARTAARRAAARAQTVSEAYRSAELLVLIEHELGHHQTELHTAQTLIELRPQDPRAQMVRRRAARCNGLDPFSP